MQLPTHRPGGVQSLGRADTSSGAKTANAVQRALKPATDYALNLNEARKESDLLGSVSAARSSMNNLSKEMEALASKRLDIDDLSESEREMYSDILKSQGYVPGNRVAADRYEKGRISITNAHRPKDAKQGGVYDKALVGHEITYGNRVRDAVIKGDRLEIAGAKQESLDDLVNKVDARSLADATAEADRIIDQGIDSGVYTPEQGANLRQKTKELLNGKILGDATTELLVDVYATNPDDRSIANMENQLEQLKRYRDSLELTPSQRSRVNTQIMELGTLVGKRKQDVADSNKLDNAWQAADEFINQGDGVETKDEQIYDKAKTIKDPEARTKFIDESMRQRDALRRDRQERTDDNVRQVKSVVSDALAQPGAGAVANAKSELEKNRSLLDPGQYVSMRNALDNFGRVTNDAEFLNSIREMSQNPQSQTQFMGLDFYNDAVIMSKLDLETRTKLANMQRKMRDPQHNYNLVNDSARTLANGKLKRMGLKDAELQSALDYVLARVWGRALELPYGQEVTEQFVDQAVEDALFTPDTWGPDDATYEMMESWTEAGINVRAAVGGIQYLTGRGDQETLGEWKGTVQNYDKLAKEHGMPNFEIAAQQFGDWHMQKYGAPGSKETFWNWVKYRVENKP